MPKRKNPAERVAYHEAGHAVAAVILRMRFAHATIVPNQEAGSLGHVDPGKHPNWAAHTDMIQYPVGCDQKRSRDRYISRKVTVCLAGVAAETRFCGGRHNWIGGNSDWQNAREYAKHMCNEDDEETELFLKWMLARTKNLLATRWHWTAVEYVAKELLIRKTIQAKRVRELFEQAKKDLTKKAMGPRRTVKVVVDGKEIAVQIGAES